MSSPWYVQILAGVLAAACSGWFGLTWANEILREKGESGLPIWLEAVLPLKGRWLRLLVSSPGIAVVVLVLFAGMYPFFWVLLDLLRNVMAGL